MWYINLHPVTERTWQGSHGPGQHPLRHREAAAIASTGTTCAGSVHAGIVHGTRHMHRTVPSPEAPPCADLFRVSARLGSGLGAGLSTRALQGTHRLHRLSGSTRGGDLLGTRRRRKLGHTPHHGNQRQHRHQKQHAWRQAPTGTGGWCQADQPAPIPPNRPPRSTGLLIPFSPTIRLPAGMPRARQVLLWLVPPRALPQLEIASGTVSSASGAPCLRGAGAAVEAVHQGGALRCTPPC